MIHGVGMNAEAIRLVSHDPMKYLGQGHIVPDVALGPNVALLNWLRGFRSPPRRTFVVHGEPTAAAALAEVVERELGWREVAVAEADVPCVLN